MGAELFFPHNDVLKVHLPHLAVACGKRAEKEKELKFQLLGQSRLHIPG